MKTKQRIISFLLAFTILLGNIGANSIYAADLGKPETKIEEAIDKNDTSQTTEIDESIVEEKINEAPQVKPAEEVKREGETTDAALDKADNNQEVEENPIDIAMETIEKNSIEITGKEKLVKAKQINEKEYLELLNEGSEMLNVINNHVEQTSNTIKPMQDTNTRPTTLDGSNIETLNVKWLTEDTFADDDENLLSQKWVDDNLKSVKAVINFALSGQHPYPRGTVSITIPKTIFTDREGNVADKIDLAVPEAPSSGGMFSYIETEDSYVLTNTKELIAATSGYIELSFTNLKPHMIKDYASGYITEPFFADLEVTTHQGNIIGKTSNELTARIDTSAEISNAEKRGGVIQTRPDNFPTEFLPENPEDWVYAIWHIYAYVKANQTFSVNVEDSTTSFRKLGEDTTQTFKGAQVAGVKVSDTGEIIKGNGTSSLTIDNFFQGFKTDENYFYATVYTMYPKSELEPGQTYYIENDVKYTLIADDDKEKSETDASAELKLGPVITELPDGHFIVHKYGVEKTKNDNSVYDWRHSLQERIEEKAVYPYTLNKLKDGKDVDLRYKVDTIGFGMPWTKDYSKLPEDIPEDKKDEYENAYGHIPYKMITRDYAARFDLEEQDLTPEDFYFHALDVKKPLLRDYVKFSDGGYDYYEKTNEDGTSVIAYGPVKSGNWGYRVNSDNANQPDLEVYGKGKDGEFIHYATVSFKTGTKVITPFNGASVDGEDLVFPDKSVIEYKIETSTKMAAMEYVAYPTIRLLSNEKTKQAAETLFKNSDLPNTVNRNYVDMNVEVGEDKQNLFINKAMGQDTLTGFANGVKLNKSLTYENDVNNKQVLMKYKSVLDVQTNLTDKKDLDEVISEGGFKEEKSATWYDLLPTGVKVNTKSIKLRAGDKIDDIQLIENYKDSGRDLLVVKATLTPRYVFVTKNKSIINYEGLADKPEISFDATYPWTALNDYGEAPANRIVYESNNEKIGSIKLLSGEPDDPLAGKHSHSKTAAGEDAGLLKDLNPNHNNESFVYGYVRQKLEVNTTALTSIHKQVDVENENKFSDGLDELQAKNVFEGGKYTYQLRVQNPKSNSSTNILIYDNLEKYRPTEDKEDFKDIQWQGIFQSIDVSQLKLKGVNPIVYYSTRDDLILDDTNNRAHNDLSDTSIWSTTMPQDKSTIKAIAIDASKKADGSDFELGPDESLSALIHMRAPLVEDINGFTQENKSKYYDVKRELEKEDNPDTPFFDGAYTTEEGLEGGAHAYNNVVMISNSKDLDTDTVHEQLLTRQDYTKVGLKPHSIYFNKTWDDGDNRDGLRTDEVTVRLFANGVDTGKFVVLNKENEWKGAFEDILYMENDKPIKYELKEDKVDGYEFITGVPESDEYKLVYNTINKHEPEKINIKGTKTWTDLEEDTVLPESIQIELYANDKLYLRKTVRPNKDNEWVYSFDDLYKFENGKEIKYEIKERPIDDFITTYDGFNIDNRYYPFGDISLSKKVINGTKKALEQEFEFKIAILDKEGQEDFGKYDYFKGDTKLGQLSSGSIVKLKDNENIIIKDIPSGFSYEIVELEKQGFTVDSTNAKGTIKSDKPQDVLFNNTYDTQGRIILEGDKKLIGKDMKMYQFLFDVYNKETQQIIKSGYNTTDGKIVLGALHYGLEDADKTFTYQVKERNLERPGYTYDSHVEEFTVDVVDNGDGTITATVNFDEDGISFENKYEAKGTVNIKAFKQIEGKYRLEPERPIENKIIFKSIRPISSILSSFNTNSINQDIKTFNQAVSDLLPEPTLDPNVFKFELYDPETGDIVATGYNDISNGEIVFSDINYTHEDVGKTFVYRAREVNGGDERIIYDTSEIEYTIEVFDNDDGTLSFKSIVKDLKTDDAGNEETMPVFYNKYKDGKLTIEKQIKSGNPNEEFRFKVKLTGEDGLVPEGEFNLNREKVTNYTALFTSADGVTLDPIVITKDKNEFILPKVGDKDTDWTIGNVTIPSGSKITYEILPDGNIKINDYEISPDENNNFVFKEEIKPGRIMWKVEGDTLTIYPENGVIGEAVGIPGEKEWDPAILDIYNAGTGLQEQLPNENSNVKYVKTEGKLMLKGSLTSMFENSQATSLDLSSFDTSSVTSMSYMFQGAQATSLDLSNFDTSSVTNMSYMFSGSQATSLDLSNFDTSNVTSMISMFSYSQATSLDLSNFDTSQVTDMRNMFYKSQATSLDLSNFDTSQVTDMSYMFSSSQATSLNLSNFDTSNVADMSSMFYKSQATSLDLSSFDTSNVADMSSMFYDSQATSLDLSSFDTSSVTKMSSMFRNSQATSLDLSSFDTSNVTNMSRMFYNSKATTLDLSSFDTSQVTDMSRMFYGSKATTGYARTQTDADKFNSSLGKPSTLTFTVGGTGYKPPVVKQQSVSPVEQPMSINGLQPALEKPVKLAQPNNLTNRVTQSGTQGGVTWEIYEDGELVFSPTNGVEGTFNNISSSATTKPWSAYEGQYSSVRFEPGVKGGSSLSYMFYNSQATTLDLSSFDTSQVTNMSGMFYNSQATTLDLSSFDTSQVTDMSVMFFGSQATSLDLSSFDTSKVNNMSSMFRESKATTLDLSSFDTSKVTNMYYMFYGSQATSLDLSSFDTSQVTNMGSMFFNSQATTLDLSNFDTSQIKSMNQMFYGSQATTLDLSSFDTSQVTNMGGMFFNSQATTLDLSSFDTSQVTNMIRMFSGSKATTLDLSSFDTSQVTNMSYMFFNSEATTLDLSSFDTSQVTNMGSMFNNSKSQRLELSPNFKFKDTNPPTITKSATYTGKWIREDKTYGPYTNEEFVTKFNANSTALAGTWIAEKAPEEYTIKFDANGGTGNVPQIIAEKGVEFNISKPGFYQFGKRLISLNTKADGNGVSYNFDTPYKDIANVGETITLYAIWEDVDNSINIQDGEFEVILQPGEKVSLDLPTGVHYEVYEETKDGWILVESKNDKGLIVPLEESKTQFLNDYRPGTTQARITAQKLVNNESKEAGGFMFELVDNNQEVISVTQSTMNGNIVFQNITYSSPGRYEYIIRENTNTTPYPGVIFDTHEEKVFVNVLDDGKGNLTASVEYDEDGAVFNNKVNMPTLPSLKVKKVLTNSNDDTLFNFKLEFFTGEEWTLFDEFSLKNGEIKEFDQNRLSSIPSHFKWRITETNIPKGYKLESISHNEFTLDDVKDVVVEVKNSKLSKPAYFQPKATKVMEQRELKDGEFTFAIFDGTEEIARSFNDKFGNVYFDAIELQSPGEYNYTVKEINQVDENIEYDTHEGKIKVIVKDETPDNADDELSIEVIFDEKDLTFTNKVKDKEVPEEEKGDVVITKFIDGLTEANKEKEFDVVLSLEKDGTALVDKYNYTSSLGNQGEVSHGEILKIKHNEKITVTGIPKDTVVKIKETVPNGYSVDKDSVLTGTIGSELLELNLINNYTTVGSWNPVAKKNLEGAKIEDYNFAFSVLHEGQILETVNNNDKGEVLFSSIDYTIDDIGKEFTYTIFEREGRNYNIDYDTSEYSVTLVIKDDGLGKLTPEITNITKVISKDESKEIPIDSEIVFNNKYNFTVGLPSTGSITIIASLIGMSTMIYLAWVFRKKNKEEVI